MISLLFNHVAVERGEIIFSQVILQDEATFKMFYLLTVGEDGSSRDRTLTKSIFLSKISATPIFRLS